MSKTYLYQLGTNTALSYAEIVRVFQHSEVSLVDKNALVKTESALVDAQKTLDGLGGTLRIADVLPTAYETAEEAIAALPVILEKLHKDNKTRITFSSGFLTHPDNALREALENESRHTKHALKEAGHSVRYVALQHSDKQLSPASVFHNDLATSGYEILFFENNYSWYAAKTVAVQNIDAYSYRDEHRPFRDKRLGMIPLKVAQILLNLGEVKRGTRILDPFCGLGTILSEGLMMQAQVSGSDISQDVIEQCKKNLEWYKEKLVPRASFALQVCDVLKLSSLWKKPFDVIISEGYLGQPIRGAFPNPNIMKKTFDQSTLLLTSLFQEAKKGVLIPGGKIVICAPYFQAKNGTTFGPYLDRIRSFGYTQRTLLPDSEGVSSFEETRGTLLYARPDAHVGREISVWELTQ